MKSKHIAFLLSALLTWSFLASMLPHNGVVSAASSENSRDKVFYFHNATKTIFGQNRYIMNTTLPVEENYIEVNFTDAAKTFSWYIDPPLAGDLSLNGTITLYVWMKLISGAGEGTLFATLGLGLYEIDKNGTKIRIVDEGDAANQATIGPITSHLSEYFVSGNIGTAYTASAGSRLEVLLSISSNDRVEKYVVWGSDNFRSRVSLPAVNHIAVDRIDIYNATGGQPSYFESNDIITFKATILNPFGGYDIRWINFTLEAPDGSFVFLKASMVRTSGNDTSLVSIYELTWDTANKTRGTYNVTVEAVDNTGYYYRFPDRPGDETFGGHLESLTVTLSIGKVIYANFLIVDSIGEPLVSASLELWDGTSLVARVVTNETGYAKISNVPGVGDYTARVWWQDVKVFDQTISISDVVPEDNPIILENAVYYPTFRIVDDALVPLGDASVLVTHPNGNTTIIPFKTDLEGQFGLTQTAGGIYALRITWSGVDVGVKSVNVSSNEVHVVKADVFYLTVETRDPSGNPVESVHVIVNDVARALVADSKLSNASGITISRLPSATYNIEATWLGAPVGTTQGVVLNQSLTMVMNLQIFDVQIEIVDERQKPLKSATVEVTFEGFKVIGTSDTEGQVAFKLPGGTLNLMVWWRDVLVFNGTKTVDETTTTLTVTTQVHYVTVKTVDKDGAPLSGVSLTLQKDGVTIDGGITKVNGTYEFREPIGEYTVIAYLKTTYLLTDIDQIVTKTFSVPGETVIIRFAEFPPPFTSTVLFPIIVFGVLVPVGIAILLLLGFRRRLWFRRQG
jgi:hypothetical protein